MSTDFFFYTDLTPKKLMDILNKHKNTKHLKEYPKWISYGVFKRNDEEKIEGNYAYISLNKTGNEHMFTRYAGTSARNLKECMRLVSEELYAHEIIDEYELAKRENYSDNLIILC